MSGRRRPTPPERPSVRPRVISDPPISDVTTNERPTLTSDVAPTRPGAPPRAASGLMRTSTQPPPADAHLSMLVQLASTLPLEEGIEAVAEALCATVQEAVPESAVGVVIAGEGRDGGALIETTAAPHSTRSIGRALPGVPVRLFPTLADEWVVVLPPPLEGASIHVADFRADGPAVDESSERTGREPLGHGDPRGRLLSEVAERASLVLASALRAVHQMRAHRGDGSKIRELQARIIHTEKLASIGQIAAQVVHELNNPLTAIVTYADYLIRKLERDGHDENDLERLRRIGESADRILRFSRELTTYARPNETAAPLAIQEVLDRAVIFCEHIIVERGIKTRTHVDVATPTMLGLRGQLTQVFVNLITNACHAIQDAGRDGGEIAIEAGPHDDGGIRVSIGDNGNGISPENVIRVFDPFYTTKSEGRGTGLGLSIVRSIVESHGGRVWVRSVVGSGSQFVVELAPKKRG